VAGLKRCSRAVPAQTLLIPEIIELSEEQILNLMDIKPDLSAMGLDVDRFGGNAICVRSTPAILGEANVAGLVDDILDELESQGSSTVLAERINAILSRVSAALGHRKTLWSHMIQIGQYQLDFNDPLVLAGAVGAVLLLLLFVLIFMALRAAGRSARASEPLAKYLTELGDHVRSLDRGQENMAGRLQAVSESQVVAQATMVQTMEKRLEDVQLKMGRAVVAGYFE